MNKNQLTSTISTVLTLALGALVSKGFISGDTSNAILSLVGSFIVWWVAHHQHAAPVTGQAPATSAKFPAALLIVGLSLSLFSGCATSYKAEKTADITITAAMSAWGDYVAANHPPAAQELAVKNAFEKYQSAEVLWIDATAALLNASPTNTFAKNLAAAKSADVSNALADLVKLLSGFGVKLKL